MRLLFFCLCLGASSAFAWGFDGHRYLASKMQDPLPTNACLRQWFAARQTTTLQDRSCDPDRYRYMTAGANYDPEEGPRHYLEIDWIQPTADYPRDYAQVQARIGALNAKRNGTVPWRVEALYGELVAAFRAQDQARILDRAFFLSHYVMDSFSVFHATKNSDPNGVHARWESDLLGVNANLNAIGAQAAGLYGTPGLADPRNNVFDVVRVGQPMADVVAMADVATPNDLPAFQQRVKDLTARRFADALTLMASILWSAWAEAGAPSLAGFSASCSRATPTAEVVFRGHPIPGGFTHPPLDGGVPGGGAGGGTAGGSGGGVADDAGVAGAAGGGAGGGDEMPQPAGCSCQSGAGALGLLALVMRRRRA